MVLSVTISLIPPGMLWPLALIELKFAVASKLGSLRIASEPVMLTLVEPLIWMLRSVANELACLAWVAASAMAWMGDIPLVPLAPLALCWAGLVVLHPTASRATTPTAAVMP